jgi:hypothetical protein
VLGIYKAGHKTGELRHGLFMEILTRDDQEKMANEAASLLNSSYDPPLTLRPAPLPEEGPIQLHVWEKNLRVHSDNMMPATVIRGVTLERGMSGRYVTLKIFETGAVLGYIQRLTRDPTKKWANTFLMNTLTYTFGGAAARIRELSGAHPALAGLEALADDLKALEKGLAQKEAYKTKRPAQFRAIADDADTQVRAAIRRLQPGQDE